MFTSWASEERGSLVSQSTSRLVEPEVSSKLMVSGLNWIELSDGSQLVPNSSQGRLVPGGVGWRNAHTFLRSLCGVIRGNRKTLSSPLYTETFQRQPVNKTSNVLTPHHCLQKPSVMV